MAETKPQVATGGLPPKPEEIHLAPPAARRVDWRRIVFIALGLAAFTAIVLSPRWPDAVDPAGEHFVLSREGKAAMGLFMLALIWWVFEVVPIGVTAIAIGVVQALFLIRPAKTAFTDFMDPSVWFIFGSLVIGMVFTKTGLTKRIAYRTLMLVGERTSMIYLGCFAMTAALTLVMAHTAVAATVYPLLMAIHSLYQDDDQPTRFGKGLFIGMAFVAGAGSVVTLLGAARGPAIIVTLSLRSFVPALEPLDKSAIILVSTILFFMMGILGVKDLEDIPWNIILLFGGAMSIGLCLWQTGAASWLAVNWLVLFQDAHWLVFVLGVALFVLVMTNFIMNVAAIAICLPVALVIAGYLHVAPEVILFSALATAGMPFLLLIGAAPNAIAYGSRQFTSGEFFTAGVPASLMLMVVLGLFIWFVWPLMGMPVLLS